MSGKTGVFPMNFVRDYTETETEKGVIGNKHKIPFYGKAKYDYEAGHADELSFQEGDILDIKQEGKDGWYIGTIGSKSGLIPGNYIIPIDQETGDYLLNERKVSFAAVPEKPPSLREQKKNKKVLPAKKKNMEDGKKIVNGRLIEPPSPRPTRHLNLENKPLLNKATTNKTCCSIL